jgi:RimJ/RimL family protein N-acetyltransferase
VLMYQLIQQAKDDELRAVRVLVPTHNAPMAALLEKLGFELSGIDTRHRTNHDLVKESATTIWYYETE